MPRRRPRRYLVRIYNNGSRPEYIILARSRSEAQEQARLIMKSFPLARGFDLKQLRRPAL